MNNNKIVINGYCNDDLFGDMIKNIWFSVYDQETVVGVGTSDIVVVESHERTYSVIISNLPFSLCLSKVTLIDIEFDELDVPYNDFEFVIDSIESSDKTTTLDIQPREGRSPHWYTKEEEQQKQPNQPKEETNMQDRVTPQIQNNDCIRFFIRTNMTPEKVEKSLTKLHFIDSMRHDGLNKYTFEISSCTCNPSVGDQRYVVFCHGILYYDTYHTCVSLDRIATGDPWLKLSDITLLDDEGKPIGEDGHWEGYIDMIGAQYKDTYIPWKGDKLDQCQPGTIYLDLASPAQIEEITDNLIGLKLRENGRNFNFHITKYTDLGSSDASIHLELQGTLYDPTAQQVDVDYINDRDCWFVIWDLVWDKGASDNTIRSTGIRKCFYVSGRCKGIELPLIFDDVAPRPTEDKSVKDPEHSLKLQMMLGDAELIFKKTERRDHVSFYQVRKLDLEETKDLEHLKYKHIDPLFDLECGGPKMVMDDSIAEICSELVVPKNVTVNFIEIDDGGYVTVEQGGHVEEAWVHEGGTLELCGEAVVDTVVELGGAVHGGCKTCASSVLSCGRISEHQYATLHKGTIMTASEIDGCVQAMDHSYTKELTVFGTFDAYGGIHCDMTVRGGGTLHCGSNSVIVGLHAAEGSRVVIFKGAKLIHCQLDGDIEYHGENIYSDPAFTELSISNTAVVTEFKEDDILEKKLADLHLDDEEEDE